MFNFASVPSSPFGSQASANQKLSIKIASEETVKRIRNIPETFDQLRAMIAMQLCSREQELNESMAQGTIRVSYKDD